MSLSMIFCNCQDDVLKNTEQEYSINEKFMSGIVYPKSQSYSTKSNSFETNWENMNFILTTTGKELYLPWSTGLSDPNIPISLAFDIKKEDGWEMLFHTFNTTDSETDNRHFMAFYNIRTGLMKIFGYYPTVQFSNNGGMWHTSFTGSSKFLQHTPEIAEFINTSNSKPINIWTCTNATQQGNKAFSQGWNCYIIPISYFPNQPTDNYLDVNTSVLNEEVVNLFGENNSYSKGTILTHGSVNTLSPLTSDLSTVFGNEAGQYLENIINEKEGTKSIIAGGAAAIAKFGLNKIFSKLTASFNVPTVKRSDLEFTTKGVINLSGNITFNGSSQFMPIRVPFGKDKVGELGSWNLRDMPTVYIDPRANYVPSSDDYYREYWYKLRGVSKYKYDIVINPALQSKIKKYWVDCALIRYWDHTHKDSVKIRPEVPSFYTNFGSLGRRNVSGGFNEAIEPENLLYKKFMEKGSIYETKMQPKIYVKDLYGQYQGPIPVVLVPKVNSYEQHYFDSSNLYLKVTLNTVTEINGKIDTTMSTRTFIPKIEWDPNIYNQLKDVDMKDLVHYNHIK